MEKNGFTEQSGKPHRLNRMGILFMGRLLVHFDPENASATFGDLDQKFENFERLSVGKNSIVVKARHRLMQTEFILKIVRPGAKSRIVQVTLMKLVQATLGRCAVLSLSGPCRSSGNRLRASGKCSETR